MKITRENYLDLLFNLKTREERLEMSDWIAKNIRDLTCKPMFKWSDLKIDSAKAMQKKEDQSSA